MSHDHSHMGMDMGHGGMVHGGMNHGGMDMGGSTCSMNMIFTFSNENLCIIFEWWKVTGPWSLIFSLVGVALLTAGYEGLRDMARRYEAYADAELEGRIALPEYSTPPHPPADAPSSSSSYPRFRFTRSLRACGMYVYRAGKALTPARERQIRMAKASYYALQVFYSFFIMLLFMTYNGWVMIAVGVGAFIGFMAFGSGRATKSVACH